MSGIQRASWSRCSDYRRDTADLNNLQDTAKTGRLMGEVKKDKCNSCDELPVQILTPYPGPSTKL